MSKYLLQHAQETRKDVVDVLFNAEVVNVDKIDDYWYVTLQDGRVIKTPIYINATS
jgi:2-polyprenyl-6-methoxyphenol hydroxylase-like FAD-dependent oxidoreductase